MLSVEVEVDMVRWVNPLLSFYSVIYKINKNGVENCQNCKSYSKHYMD